MKNRQKALSVLLTLAMIAGFLPWSVLPVRAAEVPLDEDINVWTNGNTYKVTRDVTFEHVRIQVSGTVSLVLGEGTTLTVPLGIYVPVGATLNISGTGALVIEGGSSYNRDYYYNKAGIGSNNEGEACGTVIINGGTITVTGGERAAGIGGSYRGAGGTVTITSGTVYATGGQSGGAGIGGGLFSENNGSLTLGGSQVVYGGGDPNPTTILSGDATNRPRYMIVKTFSSAEMHDLANATVNGVKSFYPYTGEAIAIEYTVTTANGASLNKGTDYTETVKMGGKSVQTVQAKGEYTLTITGKSPYTSSQTFHFIVSDAIPVTAETTAFEEDTPYCAAGTVIIGSRIAVSGTASLILAEGAKLTVPRGIDVPEGAALNISGTGELVIDGVAMGHAGIGGGTSKSAGTVTISGGTITVTGGEQAAGIGGGCNGSGGTVTISGGTVTATGGPYGGAGIGGGNAGDGGTVTISGGTVTATGGQSGVGIGGGNGGEGGTVTVTGGTVYATGGAPYTTGGQQCAAVGGTLALSNVAAGESDDGNNYTALTNNSSNKPYLHFCAPSLTEGVTAPAGAVLVCAAYEGGKMTGVQTLTLAADCIGKAASELLNVPTNGQYKLFLLDKTTYAPLCAAWDNKQ